MGEKNGRSATFRCSNDLRSISRSTRKRWASSERRTLTYMAGEVRSMAWAEERAFPTFRAKAYVSTSGYSPCTALTRTHTLPGGRSSPAAVRSRASKPQLPRWRPALWVRARRSTARPIRPASPLTIR